MSEYRSGIYSVFCSGNNKYYIGQTNNLELRISSHKSVLRRGCHHNVLLQRAYNKYGAQCFEYKILERCAIEELDKLEAMYIEQYDSQRNGFNLESGGNLNKVISEQTKFKMRTAKLGKPSPHKGKKLSAELRKKLSDSHMGKPSPLRGKKTGRPAWNKGLVGVYKSHRRKPVSVHNRTTNEFLGEFESIKIARTALNIKSKNQKLISDRCFNIGVYQMKFISELPM